MTHPEDEDAGTDGRPWPASGLDADWWRDETADAPKPPLDEEPPEEPATRLEPAPRPFARPPKAKGMTERSEVPPRREVESGPVAWVTAPTAPAPHPTPAIAPFWSPPEVVEDRRVVVPAVPPQRMPAPRQLPPGRGGAGRAGTARRRRVRKPPPRPWFGLPALVALALAGAFFGWVSAEPFWLAVGHGRSGTATVVAGAEADPCRVTFVANGGVFVASNVDLHGLGRLACRSGARVAARMVSARADRAYATDAAGLHLRWMIGFALVLLCGVGIVWVTGAGRFAGWRRATSVGLSLAAPVAITLALLAAAY